MFLSRLLGFQKHLKVTYVLKRYLKKSEFSKYGKLVTISKNCVGEKFIWFESSVLTTFSYSKDHPYITSAKRLGRWVHKIAIFADGQYCIYADIMGQKKSKIMLT